MPATRRDFLKVSSGVVGSLLASPATARSADEPAKEIRVVVWDEQQPAQKQAYENFLGNEIAGHLKRQPGLSVRSVSLNEPNQGLDPQVLDACDVLIWWGHARQAEVAPASGQAIVERIKAGRLALIALHSAHWSTPFVEAMNERARLDVARMFSAGEGNRLQVREVAPPQRYTVPKRDTRLTPYLNLRKFPDGRVEAALQLPYCCFPSYRSDGKPSQLRVLKPEHPIAAGVPPVFELARTEMYDEPFHVPEPDEVIFEERWEPGEWFRSGMVWNLGQGRVFYFRPGHETYPIFKDPNALRVVTNAVRWLSSRPG